MRRLRLWPAELRHWGRECRSYTTKVENFKVGGPGLSVYLVQGQHRQRGVGAGNEEVDGAVVQPAHDGPSTGPPVRDVVGRGCRKHAPAGHAPSSPPVKLLARCGALVRNALPTGAERRRIRIQVLIQPCQWPAAAAVAAAAAATDVAAAASTQMRGRAGDSRPTWLLRVLRGSARTTLQQGPGPAHTMEKVYMAQPRRAVVSGASMTSSVPSASATTAP